MRVKNPLNIMFTFAMTKKMRELVKEAAYLQRVSQAEYVRNLVLQDLKEHDMI